VKGTRNKEQGTRFKVQGSRFKVQGSRKRLAGFVLVVMFLPISRRILDG
jgi:hypothetical protein